MVVHFQDRFHEFVDILLHDSTDGDNRGTVEFSEMGVELVVDKGQGFFAVLRLDGLPFVDGYDNGTAFRDDAVHESEVKRFD